MKKLLFFLTTCAFISSANAYPITPRPLRKLVIESELIVWVKVIKVGSSRTNKKDLDPWDKDYALLVVNEVLQGKLKQDTIKVHFTGGMICPAPGVFFDNETALAFLDKSKGNDGYFVHALSYGVKHGLTPEDYQIYKTRIVEMQRILKMDDSNEKDKLILDWLVTCAEQVCTRWEGVYELSPFSDFMSYYDRDEITRKDFYLNSEQRKRLFGALLKIDTLDYGDLGLIDILKGTNDSSLLSILKSSLIKSNEENWFADYIMQRIVNFTGNRELEQLHEKFEEIRFNYEDKSKAKRKEIFSQFILKMKTAELKETVAAMNRSSG